MWKRIGKLTIVGGFTPAKIDYVAHQLPNSRDSIFRL